MEALCSRRGSRQKEGTFYFIAYKAGELLDKVRFTSRYYFEGEEIAQAKISDHDDVAQVYCGNRAERKGIPAGLEPAKDQTDRQLL